MPLNILLQGAGGRLGSEILGLAKTDPDLRVCALPREGDPPGDRFDVLIDVSVPEGLPRSVELAQRLGIPLVCGTTGLDAADIGRLRELALEVPVLHARNFSLGIAALRRAAAELARLLDWQAEIVDIHHRDKRDAPSGTALAIAEAIAEARRLPASGSDTTSAVVHGKAPNSTGAVGIVSLRGGTAPGEHALHLLGDDERIELRHLAEHRRLFARGALTAARRLIGRSAAWYQLEDVLWPSSNNAT